MLQSNQCHSFVFLIILFLNADFYVKWNKLKRLLVSTDMAAQQLAAAFGTHMVTHTSRRKRNWCVGPVTTGFVSICFLGCTGPTTRPVPSPTSWTGQSGFQNHAHHNKNIIPQGIYCYYKIRLYLRDILLWNY